MRQPFFVSLALAAAASLAVYGQQPPPTTPPPQQGDSAGLVNIVAGMKIGQCNKPGI